jgi:transcriptional regulator with GAF, ATPase, and Fis domain
MPSIVPMSETETDPIVRLVVALSARLTRARDQEVVPAIVEALDEIAEATKADSCQLIEFSSSGIVAEIYRSARHGDAPVSADEGAGLDEWITDRLAGGETVSTALADASLIGVPASASGQVICALVIHVRPAGGSAQPWPQPLIDRLQLLAQILGSALQGRRHESALRSSVAVIQELNARLRADNVYLKEEIKNYHDFDDIVGESAPLRVALSRVGLVAPTNSSVLLIGPTGTGKELFARALHERSRRHARPLVRVNCAALPPTLVESELFGHEKGAFTGAVGVRQGRFELADGGTIFLDEIGDLSLDVQVKFLRVLQEGEFERVGSSRTQRVDVRVIAATHQDLEAAVAEGRFRADLYYRLSVYPIRLPSLKERADDIPRLVWFFINRHQRELSRRITEVPPSVMQALQNHSWPGNVRELENVVERAMIATSGNVLQLDESLAVTKLPVPEADGHSLDAVQRAHIESILEGCGWRINGANNAAERLGIHPNTLRFRMKKLGVRRPTA